MNRPHKKDDIRRRSRGQALAEPGRRSRGLGGEDGRGPLEDLHIFAEPAVLPA